MILALKNMCLDHNKVLNRTLNSHCCAIFSCNIEVHGQLTLVLIEPVTAVTLTSNLTGVSDQ